MSRFDDISEYHARRAWRQEEHTTFLRLGAVREQNSEKARGDPLAEASVVDWRDDVKLETLPTTATRHSSDIGRSRRKGFRNDYQSEWMKARTLRSTWLVIGVATAVGVLIGVIDLGSLRMAVDMPTARATLQGVAVHSSDVVSPVVSISQIILGAWAG